MQHLSFCRLFWVVSFFLWYSPEGLALNSPRAFDSVELCIRPQLAQLKDTPHCSAKLGALFNGHRVTFCLPKNIWQSWVHESYGSPLCGKWLGHWKEPVARRNELKRIGNERVSAPLIFQVKKFVPQSACAKSWLEALWKSIERLRDKISTRLALYDPFGITRQLLINETPSPGASQIFRISGFVHLLTATGIHLYALTDLISFLMRNLCKRSGLSAGTGLQISRLMSVVTWSFAWLLSGMRPGMLRPWLVVSARMGALSLGFRWRRWSPLVCALSVDLAVAVIRDALGFPGAWAPGRWIYALAVGGGLSIAKSEGSHFEKHALLAIASWIYVAFAEIFLEGFVALATPFLSLITLPLFCLVIYPGLLVSIFLDELGISELVRIVFKVIGIISTESVRYLFAAVQRIDSVWLVSPAALLMGMTIALVCAFFRPGLRALVFIISGLVVIAVVRLGTSTPKQIPQFAVGIEQLDVGQGDAALVRTGPDFGNGLIDTGGKYGLSPAGWFGLFADRGITRLNWIALTHLDDDHAGGLEALRMTIPIDCVSASAEQWATPNGKRLNAELKLAQIRVDHSGGNCFPFPTLHLKGKAKNAIMSGMRVPLENGGFYFNGGDANKNAEAAFAAWLRRFPTKPTSERILKISHHGSKNGTTPMLLNSIRPTQTWISAGLGNLYGHPAPQTLLSLEKRKIPIFRTDRQGVIRLNK